jgi:outer membrane protein TolC
LDAQEARVNIDDALRLWPGHSGANQLDQWLRKNKDELSSSRQQSAQAKENNKRVSGFLEEARGLMGRERYQEAYEQYLKALEMPLVWPQALREARTGAADALVAQGREALKQGYHVSDFEEKIDQALELQPAHPEAVSLIGQLARREELYQIVRHQVEVHMGGLEKGFEEAKTQRPEVESHANLDMAREIAKGLSVEAVTDLVLGDQERILGLSEAIEIGVRHYGALRVAGEERSVARARVLESKRAFLPTASVTLTNVEGDVLGVDFEERSYGVELEQPLYTSGVLTNTLRQSRRNLKLANQRYDQVRQEFIFRVSEAYYDLAQAQMNFLVQKELEEEAKDLLSRAQARYDRGLSRRLEILDVQTQINDIAFQIAQAHRDLAISQFKFKELIGGENALFYTVEDEVVFPKELYFEPLEINFDEVLELSSSHHPDILVGEIQVEVAHLEEKIAKGKGGMRVDLTGFVGQAGSNFETEELDMSSEKNIGLRVTRIFGGSTIASALTDDESAPRLGETTRTASTTRSVEFNLWDALKGTGDAKEARVAHHRAQEELKDVEFEVSVETQEAFYGYQEAVIQVRNTVEKVSFQEEAVKITESDASLNTSLTSDVLEAKIKLADERSLYVQALANYSLSIAKLNKAIGVADHFRVDGMSQEESNERFDLAGALDEKSY